MTLRNTLRKQQTQRNLTQNQETWIKAYQVSTITIGKPIHSVCNVDFNSNFEMNLGIIVRKK